MENIYRYRICGHKTMLELSFQFKLTRFRLRELSLRNLDDESLAIIVNSLSPFLKEMFGYCICNNSQIRVYRYSPRSSSIPYSTRANWKVNLKQEWGRS